MKNIQKITLLGIIGIPAILASSQAALIAHFKLDEASGATTAINELGNNAPGYNGTVIAATSGVTGISGNAYEFNGTNSSRIDVPNPAFAAAVTTSQSLTMSAWLMRTGTTGTPAVISFGNSGASDQYYQLSIEGAFARAVNRSANFEKTLGDDAINDNMWHHLVATVSFNGTDTFLELYVDGVLDSSRTVTGDIPPNALNVLSIGALSRTNGGNPQIVDAITGAIDDVQIYDQVLSQSQITFLKNNPGVAIPEPGTAMLSLLCLPVILRRRR